MMIVLLYFSVKGKTISLTKSWHDMIQYFIPLPLKMNKQVENTSNSKIVRRKTFHKLNRVWPRIIFLKVRIED